MIPDVSQALSWLEAHPDVFDGIGRGIERETLRVQRNGRLAQTPHPESLGAALTHKYITTDFAEALLEFITPVEFSIESLLGTLRDIHRWVAPELREERMWPLSMPCFIGENSHIELAQYGSSNIGRIKTLYREGLKNRYGARMQTISGVHYNFSLPLAFWRQWCGVKDEESGKGEISAGYLRLIRNYYRFGWVIPFLFGASPAICESFLHGKESHLPFKRHNGMLYLPYATSLRLSDLGYTNRSQNALDITFNNLSTYVEKLKAVLQEPSEEFGHIGLKDEKGNYLQLNTNMLQIENELYAPIRPKRVIRENEAPSDALLRGGIEYIEIRSLDINPFSPTGVDENQVRFLDLFLIWCVLAEAPEMNSDELICMRDNWNRIVLEGRKPHQTMKMGCSDTFYPLEKIGKALFRDLEQIANVLDSRQGEGRYQKVCHELVASFDNAELTYSARILQIMKDKGIGDTGLFLAEQYRHVLAEEPLKMLSAEQFRLEAEQSFIRQKEIETKDTLDFETFLAQYTR
ncbi:glutamate--cysteine ligase [Enterobacteriaceae bacterium LUAb1]